MGICLEYYTELCPTNVKKKLQSRRVEKIVVWRNGDTPKMVAEVVSA